MNVYRVLFVDDEEEERNVFDRAAKRVEGVEVAIAKSQAEAEQLIGCNFFQLAIVDLCLVYGNDNPTPGKEVLALLRDLNPACERVVYTSRHTDLKTLTDELFSPFDRLASSILDKLDPSHRLHELIKSRSEAWSRSRVTVTGIEPVARSLARKHTDVPITAATMEVDWLVSRFFGQGRRVAGVQTLETQIRLEDVDEPGASAAVVMKGRPILTTDYEDSREGVWIVFKFSKRDAIEEEFWRYKSYISTLVARTRRVEILGVELGNRLGMICYTFAGPSPRDVRSLESVLRTDDVPQASAVIGRLFDVSEKELHGVECESQSLIEYFSKRGKKGVDFRQLPDSIARAMTEVHEQIGAANVEATLSEGKLTCHGQSLHVPKEIFTNPLFRSETSFTLIHGDLHSGNVIIGGDAVIMIDYAATGPGPRCLDFCSMDLSLRLTSLRDKHLDAIVKEAHAERNLWRTLWNPSSESIAEKMSRLMPWQQLSVTVIGHLRATFSDVGRQEYAATSFLLCGYVLGLRSLSVEQRARLLVWMSFLSNDIMEAATKRSRTASVEVAHKAARISTESIRQDSKGRSENGGSARVARMLDRMDRIILSECVVVGNYFRYDPVVRNMLKDWVQRIKKPLVAESNGLENFLAWAEAGSGKTYLVQQIAEQLKQESSNTISYVECNLAKDDESEFVRKLDLKQANAYVLNRVGGARSVSGPPLRGR